MALNDPTATSACPLSLKLWRASLHFAESTTRDGELAIEVYRRAVRNVAWSGESRPYSCSHPY